VDDSEPAVTPALAGAARVLAGAATSDEQNNSNAPIKQKTFNKRKFILILPGTP
jgi:hypothetical protein